MHVKGESDRRWVYISCKNKDELSLIKSKLKDDDVNFASIDDWMFPILTQGKEIIWNLFMSQFYLPDEINISTTRINTIPLSEKDSNIVGWDGNASTRKMGE